MLISVIGAQGCGKTTLLNQLYLKGYNVDNFKVSRSVQKELGVSSLYELTEDFKSIQLLQDKILEQKYDHDVKLKDEWPILVERSFFDLIAYTELWCSQLDTPYVPSNYWLENYKHVCLQYQKIYSGIILIEVNEEIAFEQDQNRASKDSRNQIASRLLELCQLTNIPYTILKEASLEKRVEDSISFIRKINNGK